MHADTPPPNSPSPEHPRDTPRGEVIVRHTGITAVIPVHTGVEEVEPLIEQIARSERRLGLWATPIRVRAIVVDNGCPEPIDPERLSRPLDQ
ncbi:MAG: hypothetical protein AAGB51_07940, partial [Planctomycetota bacterium]